MSYPLDLEDYPERQLREELGRRKALQLDGKCDYCGQLASTPPCKHLTRHTKALSMRKAAP